MQAKRNVPFCACMVINPKKKNNLYTSLALKENETRSADKDGYILVCNSTIQKTPMLIFATLRTSNPTQISDVSEWGA